MEENEVQTGDLDNGEVPEYDAALQFTISKNGQVYVYFSLKNENVEIENTLAKFFYDLNTGMYALDIINILQEYIRQNPQTEQILTNVMVKLGIMAHVANEDKGMDELCVNPEEFLAVGGFTGGKR
jgi:hypothetical protein